MLDMRQQRVDKGYSQVEFARRLGVDPGTIRNWELGNSNPRPCYRPALKELLECTGNELQEWFPVPPARKNGAKRLRKSRLAVPEVARFLTPIFLLTKFLILAV
jgi:transcriptional regulator with XRE-family HTH domain